MLEENKNYKQYTIAEMSDGIILTNFEKNLKVKENSYQSEAELEKQLIENLVSQGYERLIVKTNEDLYSNLKIQIERLNNIHFSDNEWNRFLTEYLDSPNEGMIEKTRKIQENHIHDFIFDNGILKNIKIIDKKNIYNNFMQVTSQVWMKGTNLNRYDVTILVNGLPLVHIELKKRGVNLHEAFDQHRIKIIMNLHVNGQMLKTRSFVI